MSAQRVIDFPGNTITCTSCRLGALCVPEGLPREHVQALEQLVRHAAPVRRGQVLFRSDKHITAVYAVRAGSFRTYHLAEDGHERVLGFHLPGELLGFDGLGTGRHRCTAEALETAAVCALPIAELQALADRLPSLNHQLYRLMSAEIGRDQDRLLLLSEKNAPERLAAFLCELGERFARRGLSADEFHLSMSRQNIANYLGLTIETVSRSFTQLQKEGFLDVERRHVRIRDRVRLSALAGGSPDAPSFAAH